MFRSRLEVTPDRYRPELNLSEPWKIYPHGERDVPGAYPGIAHPIGSALGRGAAPLGYS
jgi:hypothetical protein